MAGNYREISEDELEEAIQDNFGKGAGETFEKAVAQQVGRNNTLAQDKDTRQNQAFAWGGKSATADPNGPYGSTIAGTGGAAEDAAYYRGRAGQNVVGAWGAQSRGAPQINYDLANFDRGQGYLARQGQELGGNMMLARAMGHDLASERQAAIDANRLYQQQASAAASARGPAGLAMAQQNRAAATAAGQSAISQQAQVAAAQERAGYTQQYLGAKQAQRAQDLQAQGISAQQAQAQAQLEAGQRQANDQFTLGLEGIGMGYERLGYDVNKAQLETNTELEKIREGNWQHQSSLDADAVDDARPTSDERAKQNVASADYGSEIASKAVDAGQASSGASAMKGTAGALDAMSSIGPKSDGGSDYLGTAAKIAGTMAMMFSDERAKTKVADEAYLQGQADQMRRQFGALGSRMSPMEAYAAKDRGPSGLSKAMGQMSDGEANKIREAMAAQYGRSPMEEYRNNEIKRTLDAAPPKTWEYKPGLGPPGRQAGPMAQDLEKASPVGAAMVHTDPATGLKKIDNAAATRFNMAANSYNNQRIDQQQSQIEQLRAQLGAQYGEAPTEKYAMSDRKKSLSSVMGKR